MSADGQVALSFPPWPNPPYQGGPLLVERSLANHGKGKGKEVVERYFLRTKF